MQCILKLKCALNYRNLRHYNRLIQSTSTAQQHQTLHNRMLLYLNNYEPTKQVPKRKVSENLLEVLKKRNYSHLNAFKPHQLINVVDLIPKDRDFAQSLNALDAEFTTRLPTLSRTDTFKILQSYTNIAPTKITQLKFYKTAIAKLYNQIDDMPKSDLIQLIFFIGLQKKTQSAQSMLKSCMRVGAKYYDELSTEELCIVCNSLFKSGTKMTSVVFLRKIRSYINDHLAILSDAALFVSFIKVIRQNRYQNDDLLNTISCTLFFNKALNSYNFTSICHVLALYADYNYYDERVFAYFVEKCLEILRKNESLPYADRVRFKDIKRLLWALSTVDCRVVKEEDFRAVLVPRILERIAAKDYEDAGSLIEVVLYLWMMKYQAVELVPYVFSRENLQKVKNEQSPSKIRLNLLLSAIFYENRQLFNQLKIHPSGNNNFKIDLQVKLRPALERVLHCLKPLAAEYKVSKFELTCAVPYLNMVGITGYDDKAAKVIFIEVLDEISTVKNTEQVPNGLMALKLRILNGMEEALVVIGANDIESLTEAELRDYLSDELNLVI